MGAALAARLTKEEMGSRIREIRERRRLTQAQVATRLGMTEGGYRAYEAGRSEPSFTTIPDLADALGVHPCLFFLEDVDPANELDVQRGLRLAEFEATVTAGWSSLDGAQQRVVEEFADSLRAQLQLLAAGLIQRERNGAL